MEYDEYSRSVRESVMNINIQPSVKTKHPSRRQGELKLYVTVVGLHKSYHVYCVGQVLKLIT